MVHRPSAVPVGLARGKLRWRLALDDLFAATGSANHREITDKTHRGPYAGDEAEPDQIVQGEPGPDRRAQQD